MSDQQESHLKIDEDFVYLKHSSISARFHLALTACPVMPPLRTSLPVEEYWEGRRSRRPGATGGAVPSRHPADRGLLLLDHQIRQKCSGWQP
jgi:hypothetical protein